MRLVRQMIRTTVLIPVVFVILIFALQQHPFVSHARADEPTAQPDVVKLREQLIAERQKALDLATQLYQRGLGDFGNVEHVRQLLCEAQLRAARTPEERRDVLQKAIKLAKDVEELTTIRFNAGLVSELDRTEATGDRLELELRLAEEK